MGTKYTKQVTYNIPTNKLDDINSVFDVLGFGPNNFSAPFSPSGNANATHYSCVISMMPEEQIRVASPPKDIDWAAYGLTKQSAASALSAMKQDVKISGTVKRKSHMLAHATHEGLKAIKRVEEITATEDLIKGL